jgi:hypothetical protein
MNIDSALKVKSYYNLSLNLIQQSSLAEAVYLTIQGKHLALKMIHSGKQLKPCGGFQYGVQPSGVWTSH